MRMVLLNAPAHPHQQQALVARLTRHLVARLQDLGPDGPALQSTDTDKGCVCVSFPNRTSATIVAQLADNCSVFAALEGDLCVFYLSPNTSFEDLDYVWGGLFQLLSSH